MRRSSPAYKSAHEPRRIQPLRGSGNFESRHFGYDDAIGQCQGIGQLGLKHIAASGVGARLEHGPQVPGGEFKAQGSQGFANRGGVMPEIVHDRYPAAYPADFHPSFDSREGVKGPLDLRIRQAAMLRTGDHRERVPHVQFTHQANPISHRAQIELG